ncbi:serine hydrolase [Flavobacterium sp. MAH-1]|uniref:Serine hydrolase n=1 Tax=Flavobacterium agri TaxID=2743471 RepID=A0A7Y8Y2E6_9FLAO|nr:serine hydrolase [Flavobacterium agri]NUY81116.1 serine hydrolase [Flavobacterium agri]NYA71140.1 serine hydrolase [Flavobacterium agri]
MKKIVLTLSIAFALACCSNDDGSTTPEAMYFPAVSGDSWETKTPAELGWNESQIQSLLDFLQLKHSKSFMILVNGKIVMEHYFNGHTSASPWYWASAGKTLTSTAVGIAQQQGLLDINDPVSDYLGQGWTDLTPTQESQITIKHLLTMTSGLDDAANGDCTDPECLVYLAPAGTRWAYDNVYVILQQVVASASGQTWDAYFDANIKNKIGMTGLWSQMDELSVYFSTTRSMARFGLLALNDGKWQNEQVIPQSYLNAATHPSQNINKSYGYLWWINGESSYHLPQSQLEFPGSVIPSGPTDMFMALGKNDQKIYVIPSRKMVVVRMGDAADESNWALSGFDEDLWVKINAVIE